LDYRLSDRLSLELLGQFTEADKELPKTVVAPNLDDEQNTQNWLISPGVRYATDTFSAHLFYSKSESRTTLDQVNSAFGPFPGFAYLGEFPISNTIEVESDELNLQADYSLTDDALLTVGLLYRKDDSSNSNFQNITSLNMTDIACFF
jgi:hypothetical protein